MKIIKNRFIKSCCINDSRQTFSTKEVVNLLSSILELEDYEISYSETVDGVLQLNIGNSTYFVVDDTQFLLL